LWAASGGVTRSLQVCHGSGRPLISLLLTSFSFPICAWIEEITRSIFPCATNIQCPPDVHIGNTNVPYPTLTIDVAKTHESEIQLLADAVNKHFAAMTGVMVWLGIKIYPTHRMKITLRERDVTQGFGAVDPPLAYTGFISTVGPCAVSITIPKRLIFHGVPNNLVPPTATPDFIVDLNHIREAIELNFFA
jgi:hypothetical protein